MRKCPYCSEEIQDEAKKCRFCGEWLNEKKDNQEKKIEKEEFNPYNALKVQEKFALFFLGRDEYSFQDLIQIYNYFKFRAGLEKEENELIGEEKEYRKYYLIVDEILDKTYGKEKKEQTMELINKTHSLRFSQELLKFLNNKYGKDIKQFEGDNFINWLETQGAEEYSKESTIDWQDICYNINYLNIQLGAYVQYFFDDYSNNETIQKIEDIIANPKSTKDEIISNSKTLLEILDKVYSLIITDSFKVSIEVGERLFELEESIKLIEDKESIDILTNFLNISEKNYLYNIVKLNSVKTRLEFDRISPNKMIENGGDNSITFNKDIFEKLGNSYSYLSLYTEEGNKLIEAKKELDKKIYGMRFDEYYEFINKKEVSEEEKKEKKKFPKIKYFALYIIYLILYFIILDSISKNIYLSDILTIILVILGLFLPKFLISRLHC